MLIETKKDLAKAYRQGPYAFPGGYPVYLLMTDGCFLCWECFKNEYRNIWEGTLDPAFRTGWKPDSLQVLWEHDTSDNELTPTYCDHCSKELDAAYN